MPIVGNHDHDQATLVISTTGRIQVISVGAEPRLVVMTTQHEKRVYRDSEPAIFEHLECLLDAGFTEIEEDRQLYRVTLGRGEDWTPYFVLRPVFSEWAQFGLHHSGIEA